MENIVFLYIQFYEQRVFFNLFDQSYLNSLRNRKEDNFFLVPKSTKSGCITRKSCHDSLWESHDSLWESHDSLWESHDSLWESHDSLWESHDSLWESHDSLWESHDSLWESHDSLWESHDSLWESHDSLWESHDSLWESHDSLWESHDSLWESHDSLWESHDSLCMTIQQPSLTSNNYIVFWGLEVLFAADEFILRECFSNDLLFACFSERFILGLHHIFKVFFLNCFWSTHKIKLNFFKTIILYDWIDRNIIGI